MVGFGYAWYADLLPFDTETSKGLSPSIENLQQISNVVTSEESSNNLLFLCRCT